MIVTLLLLAGCEMRQTGEDPSDWYSDVESYDVQETILWTNENYDFPSNASTGIGTYKEELFPVEGFDIAFAPEDQYGEDARCQATEESELPIEIEGIVTLHPRFYIKTDGCNRDDEKYYGSYFIQDKTGALFVLGDSKVAHFEMGDRIKMRVRAIRTSFDLDMIYAHDILDIERGPFPIYWERATEAFTIDDVSEVKRISGVVSSDADTFGEFSVHVCDDGLPSQNDQREWVCEDEDDDAIPFTVTLDAELNRRGVYYPPGTALQVTGPVMYSFSTFAIAIMKIGQIDELD